MEFHYLISYNTDTKKWKVEDESGFLPDGNVWDQSQVDVMDVGWRYANDSWEELIDERCHNMLNALLPIWPEVDHGN